MKAPSATRSPLSPRALLPLASLSVLVGLPTALTMPFTGLFLADGVKASPAALGAFLFISPAAGLVASTLLARVSDRRAVRRNLLVIGAVAGATGSALFAVVRSYWVLLAVSVTLLAVSSSLIAQMFAYARQSLERTDSARAPLVISILRTLISLTWVAGPPVGALLVAKTGFGGMFLAATAFYLVVALLAVRLPELGSTGSARPEQRRGGLGVQFAFAAPAFALLQGGSALGVNAMPLFITDVLGGTAGDAGLVLGLCAALEIPLMLGFGVLAVKVDQHRIIVLGAVVALAYQSVMLATDAVWQIAAAQVLSAVVISSVMGIGISYFQAMAPDRPGFATTLYVNTITIGIMVAGPLLGLAQQLGYRTAYLMSLVMSALGVLLLLVSRVKQNGAGSR
ncbi:sugar efflux transporter [Actinokineospora diospyrosa]|uniref:sugar efflux transporter n=1 Tax=Actinokineospora diospyrosa TaxID=103728 RepID=UPI0020A3FD72|nr:sugar efflux transporter [Actinokineospora diospyrosa]